MSNLRKAAERALDALLAAVPCTAEQIYEQTAAISALKAALARDEQSPRREPLSDEHVGMLTVFPGLHHVETPVLAAFIRHIEQAINGGKT